MRFPIPFGEVRPHKDDVVDRMEVEVQ
jgi:hypothetical protein